MDSGVWVPNSMKRAFLSRASSSMMSARRVSALKSSNQAWFEEGGAGRTLVEAGSWRLAEAGEIRNVLEALEVGHQRAREQDDSAEGSCRRQRNGGQAKRGTSPSASVVEDCYLRVRTFDLRRSLSQRAARAFKLLAAPLIDALSSAGLQAH